MKKRQPKTASALTTTPLTMTPMTAPPKGRPILQKSLVILSLGVVGCAEKAKNADEDVKPEINANAEPAREEIVAPKKEPEKPIAPVEPPPASPFLQGAAQATPPPVGTPQLIATTNTTSTTANGLSTINPPPTSTNTVHNLPPHPAGWGDRKAPHPAGWGDRKAPHPPPHPRLPPHPASDF
jgi:hypothetical protein